jgi:hypothetical protein
MNETVKGAGAGERHDSTDPAPAMLTQFAGEARVKELETENARLLRLVGELLVANQLLRERCGQ